MTELSGRTREDLQAEADYLQAREDLDFANLHLAEATALLSILSSLSHTYTNHARTLGQAVNDADRAVGHAKFEADRAALTFLKAETNWAERS